MRETVSIDRSGVLRCSCGLPHGHIVGRDLLISSRHRGETHTVLIPLAQLKPLDNLVIGVYPEGEVDAQLAI